MSAKRNHIEASPAPEILKRVEELERLVRTIERGKMQWEHTFDVITDPVFIIDSEYRITRANKGLAGACEIDVRNVIGKKCFEAFAGYDRPCPRCPVSSTLKDQAPHAADLDPFPRKKRQYHVSAYSLPHNPADAADSNEIVLHYRDLTDERELQRRLMQTDKMAAIGTLAGGVAHEINNPLGAILAFAQLAMRELEKGHPCQENLKEIEEATLRCKNIVRDLLDFSRQSFEDRMQMVDVNEVITKAMSLVQVNARHQHIQIHEELADHLPHIVGHFHKLQQVLLNLVTNAMHAMKNSKGDLTLRTTLSEDKRYVVIEVSDTGLGIDKEDLGKIFDPYFTTKEQGEGTGLGLSITYKIVTDHQGKIEVESEKFKGTRFIISLPVAEK